MTERPLDASTAAQSIPRQRILVDTSRLRLLKQPTGIPRVASKYLEYGHAFAIERGVALVPIEIRRGGHIQKRRLAGLVPVDPVGMPVKTLLEVVRYFVRIAVAAVNLLHAIAPLSFLKSASRWCAGLTIGARGRLAHEYVDPGPGDILFCPGYWHDIDDAVYADMKARGAEIVLLLHDILPVTQPAFYPFPWRQIFEKRLARSLDTASHYYCVSNSTRAELLTFAARHGKTVRASVAYNGFEPAPCATVSVTNASLIARRPWLIVGTLEPKKMHKEAITTFESLWDTGYERPLVIIGGRGWMAEDIVDAVETSRWFGDRLFWLSTLGDAELAAFYSGAHALLFASVAEGFGLPLLEAASHGVPVLARKTAPSLEILNGFGRFFIGMEDVSAAILALEDEEIHSLARQSISTLGWFDWRTVVEAVIDDVLKPPGSRRVGLDLLDPRLVRPLFCDGPAPLSVPATTGALI